MTPRRAGLLFVLLLGLCCTTPARVNSQPTCPTTGCVPTPLTGTNCNSSSFTVYANQSWQDTGRAASTITAITYVSGTWTADYRTTNGLNPYVDANGYQRRVPDAPLPNANQGGLIGRAGQGQPFWVGTRLAGPIGGSGNVSLRMNDGNANDATARGLEDNAGSIVVRIDWCPPSQPAAPPAPPSAPPPNQATEQMRLFAGCNSVAATWSAGTSIGTVAAAVSPASELYSIWRYDSSLGRFLGWFPLPGAPNDYLTTSARAEPIYICMNAPGALARPVI